MSLSPTEPAGKDSPTVPIMTNGTAGPGRRSHSLHQSSNDSRNRRVTSLPVAVCAGAFHGHAEGHWWPSRPHLPSQRDLMATTALQRVVMAVYAAIRPSIRVRDLRDRDRAPGAG